MVTVKKSLYLSGILCLLVVGFMAVTTVAAQPQYPHLTPYVNDYAGVLSPDEINNLYLKCEVIREQTGVEIAIVTVKNTGGEDVIMYANRVGDANGVGSSQTDNGIVLLYSDSDIAGFAIATGRGEESVITDYLAHKYAKDAEPHLNNGQYYQAFDVALSDIQATVQAEQTVPTPQKTGVGIETAAIPIGLAAAIFVRRVAV